MVGLSLFLALLAVVLWLRRPEPTYHAPLRGPVGTQTDPAAAGRLLGALVSAVRERDPGTGGHLGASAAARTDLRGVVRNARALHVAGFSLRYVAAAGGVSAGGSWAADVAATWRFAGFDRRIVHEEVRVRFARGRSGLAIAGIGGGDRRSPLWLSGPLQVRRSARSLVLVDGSRARADRFALLARRAVPQVRQVLTHWRGGLVVEVPASERALEAELRASRGQYAGIAAVTTTVDGSHSRRSPSHVFVNPRVFDPLAQRGAQVVLTHESTHIATDAANSPAPIWLVEGFADYVALRAQRLPLTTTASRISALVRHYGVPRHLPTPAQFSPGSPHLEARYESSWLACRLLAHEAGQAALVAFYRAMDAGGALGPELRRHVGLSPRSLTRQWRTVLAHLPS